MLRWGVEPTLVAISRSNGPYPAQLCGTLPPSSPIRLNGASHALVIGIDKFTGGWPRLSNAVSDARAVAEELELEPALAQMKAGTL